MIWLVLAGFFAALRFLAGKERYKKIPKAVKTAAGIIILLSCAVFIVCQTCILSHFFDKGEKDLDYIIVLGAQMREDGPDMDVVERLVRDNRDVVRRALRIAAMQPIIKISNTPIHTIDCPVITNVQIAPVMR